MARRVACIAGGPGERPSRVAPVRLASRVGGRGRPAFARPALAGLCRPEHRGTAAVRRRAAHSGPRRRAGFRPTSPGVRALGCEGPRPPSPGGPPACSSFDSFLPASLRAAHVVLGTRRSRAPWARRSSRWPAPPPLSSLHEAGSPGPATRTARRPSTRRPSCRWPPLGRGVGTPSAALRIDDRRMPGRPSGRRRASRQPRAAKGRARAAPACCVPLLALAPGAPLQPPAGGRPSAHRSKRPARRRGSRRWRGGPGGGRWTATTCSCSATSPSRCRPPPAAPSPLLMTACGGGGRVGRGPSS